MNYLIRNAVGVVSPASLNATDIRIRAGKIADIGCQLDIRPDETVIDGRGCVVWPGLVSTHHHLAQSLLKGVPAGINEPLGEWLKAVPWRFWPHFTPTMMYHAARLGLYEMLLSGVTTCADHHYLYHRDTSPELEEAVWQAAEEIGIRFALCRGFAIEAGSHKGMQGLHVEPESIELVIDRLEATRKRHHDPASDAMARLVVAPTSLVHSSGPEALRILSDYARGNGLRRHSHLLEVGFDEQQAQAKYGMPAIDYAASNGWLGNDIWFAHLVHSDRHTINQLAASGTGIGHCPTSNCRLGSGIAPLRAMADAGVPISLGVDGSASSESASMLQELNMCWLIHRAIGGPQATRAEEVLGWGSAGGASILGLENVGTLEVGKAADMVLFDIDTPRHSAVHTPLMAPLMCGEPTTVKHSFVNGRQVVADGNVVGVDDERLIHEVKESIALLLKHQ
ncbi:amidohydrolase family protein [Carnimonas nigrificans]|uniref:amidohydrolase family protein n=1 Tax=Carnimonas nigrificans TaxID=64323 RepID=UPI0004727097|nr:amidohydrolase family protein [Carnimonas nigrificans]